MQFPGRRLVLFFLLSTIWAIGQQPLCAQVGPQPLSEADESDPGSNDPFWRVYIRLLSTPDATSEIQRMLSAGLDINEQNSNGRSILGEAVVRGNAEVIKMLLSYGADPNHADTISGYTPLHEAALRGNTVAGQLLIQYSADLNSRDRTQATPLHLASGNGQFEFVVLLLKAIANVEVLDDHDITPLHAATFYGDPRIVSVLIQSKADISARIKGSWDTPGGMTPLHIAAVDGNLTICRMLFEAGAFINAVDDDGKTPLNYAYMGEHHGVINYLTEKGGVY